MEACQVTEFCDQGDRYGEPHAAQGLEGLDDRMKPPGFAPIVQFLFKALETFGVLGDRPDVFLEDEWLGRCLTDHFRAPAEVSRAPGGAARIAAIVSEQEGFQPELRGLELAE